MSAAAPAAHTMTPADAAAAFPWDGLIAAAPGILWVVLATGIYISLYPTIRRQVLPNLGKFSAFGISLSVVRSNMDRALKLASKSPQWKVEVPEQDKEQVLQRARRNFDLMEGGRILWVDDRPENNTNESCMFQQCRMDVAWSSNGEEMLEALAAGRYDLVISDIARGTDSTAGLQSLKQLRAAGHRLPVIFYIGVIDPQRGIPPGAFGITNRPDELLHLVLDVMERKGCAPPQSRR